MRGLVWVVASQAGLQLTRMVVAICVARLLTPEEYGLAALALVFASLVLVFSDMAMGAALIQRKELSEVDRDTAFWVTLGERRPVHVRSASLLAGPVASLYGEPDAKPLLAVLSGDLRHHRARRHPAVADAARHGLPARRGAADARRARGRRGRRHARRAWTPAPGRSSASSSPPRR